MTADLWPTPYREPGYAAVRELIRAGGTRDVYENARIWAAVTAFADAMDIPN